MSTRYILAGGNDRSTNEYWLKLSQLTNKRPVKLLSCFFSREGEDINALFNGYVPFFKLAFGKDAECRLATPENLEEQIKNSDVIYFHGGNTSALRKVMDTYPGIEKYWKDKIVIGSSAGAHYLSKTYWTPGRRKVENGSGILPVNIMVHYGSSYGSDEPEGPIDWQKAEAELKKVVGNEKIVKIPEGDFVEFTV